MIELNKNQKIIAAVVVVIILLVIIYYIWDITQNSEDEIIADLQDISVENVNTENIQNNTNEAIIVHVAGAVENEGIQKLPENSRVADAIEAAGGLTIDANVNNINLAQKIIDGQKIYIPNNSENEEIEGSQTIVENPVTMSDNSSYSTNTILSDLVNINTATQTELEMLPGIGPSTASKIISYRNENGKFKSIEDILNVSGIGDSKYSQIKDKITI